MQEQHVRLAKSLPITIVLAVILSGLGHIYLGFAKRGIIILIIGIAIWAAVTWLIPIFGWVIGVIYWIWQIYDAYKLYQSKEGHTQTQSTEPKP